MAESAESRYDLAREQTRCRNTRLFRSGHVAAFVRKRIRADADRPAGARRHTEENPAQRSGSCRAFRSEIALQSNRIYCSRRPDGCLDLADPFPRRHADEDLRSTAEQDVNADEDADRPDGRDGELSPDHVMRPRIRVTMPAATESTPLRNARTPRITDRMPSMISQPALRRTCSPTCSSDRAGSAVSVISHPSVFGL